MKKKSVTIIIQILLISFLSGCVEDNTADFNMAEKTLFSFKELVEESKTDQAKNYLALNFYRTQGGDPDYAIEYLGSFLRNKKLTRYGNEMWTEEVLRLYYHYEDNNGNTGSFWISFSKESDSWKIVTLKEVY